MGSNGGVLYAGALDGGELDITETYSFDNEPVERDGRFVWDIDHIVEEVLVGLERTEQQVGAIDAVGVDTTGCDFGFVRDGELMRDPYFYRDPDVTSTVPEIFEQVTKREVFMATGITHWHVPNSLFQYHFKYSRDPDLFERADAVVNLPQVVTTVLGGEPKQDGTITSTTQMYHVGEGRWATELLGRLDLPTDVLPTVVDPGTSLGTLDPAYASRLEGDPVLRTTAGHDTA
ncbi:rhamnulokinase, partial [Halobacteriales archaeon QS_1_68_17]